MEQYAPILVFVVIALTFPVVTFTASALLQVKRSGRTDTSPYECGIVPTNEARERSSVHYYIIAVLFVIFDVETIFLFPWAVKYSYLGVFGFCEMALFVAILVVGYLYAWRKGALDWVS
jgi:NADH-quinone oxidoreductase subunit A